jgi:hypothetical protein
VGALRQVDRFEDVEVEGVLDMSTHVPRRKREVYDHGILRITGIDFTKCLTHDLFVLADTGP